MPEEGGENVMASDPLDEQARAFTAPGPSGEVPGPAGDDADGDATSRDALSGWWSRVGAVLLDGVVLIIPAIALAIALHEFHTTQYINSQGVASTRVTAHDEWLDSLVDFLYVLALLIRRGRHNGQTLGKQGTDIRIMRNDGKPVDATLVLIREGVGKAYLLLPIVALAPLLSLAFVAYFLIDYLLPLVEPEHRALHDMLARTHVVRLERGARRPPRPPPPRRGPAPGESALERLFRRNQQ